MDSVSDPDSLRDRADVPFVEETRTVDREEFESVADSVDSHAAIGITDGEGNVLLMNDGSHGWTLVAVPVESGADWTTAARRGAERLLGVEIVLEGVELVRRVDFRPASDDSRRATMYNVVFRASVDGDLAVESAENSESADDGPRFGWFEEVPDGQSGEVADDIRLFVE